MATNTRLEGDDAEVNCIQRWPRIAPPNGHSFNDEQSQDLVPTQYDHALPEYAVPMRGWLHGIYGFPQLFKHCLPAMFRFNFNNTRFLNSLPPIGPSTTVRPGIIFQFLRLLLPFMLFPLALGATPILPELDYWRIPKMVTLGMCAMGSFGTGMASLQLDMAADSTARSQPADMGLRVACSATLAVVAVFYPLWFLAHSRKARRFLGGVCFTSAASWLCVRLVGSSGNEDKTGSSGSDFLWLDKLNFFLLMAVLAGIINAERGLFSSLGEKESGARRGASDDIQESSNGRYDNEGGRGGYGDVENLTVGDRRRGNSDGADQVHRDGTGIDSRHVADIAVGVVSQFA